MAFYDLKNLRRLRVLLPQSIRPLAWRALRFIPSSLKHQDEIAYWRHQWASGNFHNDHYRGTMLAMAGESDDSFLRGKIVADFGCGPQGSLSWVTVARLRIGIDVLADTYSEFDIRSHDMVYVSSTERSIPLPSNFVDVMYSMNSIDHVSKLRVMCDEMRRVIVPGGKFFGSFNMLEPATFSEPQTLTEEKLHNVLLKHLDVQFYKIGAPSPEGGTYRAFHEGEYIDKPVPHSILWVRATKPVS
jgi:ubiquinone/menaquinone biosynthesis C-methylase UbiE